MRAVLLVPVCAFALLGAGSAGAGTWSPPAAWLAQAQCVHLKEGPWTANTGNGYFGGMQFSQATWVSLKGPHLDAFDHPGEAAHPFKASATAQLQLAWKLWVRDGRSWKSWGAVGLACSRARL